LEEISEEIKRLPHENEDDEMEAIKFRQDKIKQLDQRSIFLNREFNHPTNNYKVMKGRIFDLYSNL